MQGGANKGTQRKCIATEGKGRKVAFQLRFVTICVCTYDARSCTSESIRNTEATPRQHRGNTEEAKVSATYFFWLHVQRKLCVHTILYDFILYVYVLIPEAE